MLLQDRLYLGRDGRRAPVHGGVERPVLLDVVEVRVYRGAQASSRRQRRVRFGQLPQLQRSRTDRLGVELALAAKVMIEEPLRDLRGLRDVVDRNLVVRPLQKQTNAKLDQL